MLNYALHVPVMMSENAIFELAASGLQVVSSGGRFTAQRMARRFLRASKNKPMCKNTVSTLRAVMGKAEKDFWLIACMARQVSASFSDQIKQMLVKGVNDIRCTGSCSLVTWESLELSHGEP